MWLIKNISPTRSSGQGVYDFGKINHIGGAILLSILLLKIKKGKKIFRIQPIYSTKGLIAQQNFKKFVKQALDGGIRVQSVVDEDLEREFSLMAYIQALREAHYPSDTKNIEKARKRIILEGLIKKMAAFKLEKADMNSVNKSREYDIKKDISEYISSLPFELSPSQYTAINSLIESVCKDRPLNAILLGDVGSGKTAVAFALIYFVVKNGYQAAFMAPTEILARQHFEKAKKMLGPLGTRTELLTSSTNTQNREKILNGLKDKEIDLLIGTHSLIGEKVSFSQIALAVLDEQHRFGVAERTALIEKDKRVDTLTLSATPIPRTLRLTAFGDIELYSIEKRHQSNISTHIVKKNKRQDMFAFIAEQCKKGEKAFIVATKIDEDRNSERDSVTALFRELKRGKFKDIKIECLHGKMDQKTKDDIMRRFAGGEISAIVATSVIEVGIDVEDAGIMAIMDAENFGLAALHQLRGRVGRKGQRAYCFLYTEKENHNRLDIIAQNDDGFMIAEKDFEIRGGGDFLGFEQSGKIDTEISSQDILLARKIVDKLDVQALSARLKGEAQRKQMDRISLT